MRGRDFNSVKPYVYWLKNKITGIKYLGVRWGNLRINKTPNQDLGKIYFSSGLLKKDFKNNPKNFTKKLIATFDSIDEAREFEVKKTKKLIKNKRYANITSYPQIVATPEVIKKIIRAQRNRSEEHKRKLQEARFGRKQSMFNMF